MVLISKCESSAGPLNQLGTDKCLDWWLRQFWFVQVYWSEQFYAIDRVTRVALHKLVFKRDSHAKKNNIETKRLLERPRVVKRQNAPSKTSPKCRRNFVQNERKPNVRTWRTTTSKQNGSPSDFKCSSNKNVSSITWQLFGFRISEQFRCRRNLFQNEQTSNINIIVCMPVGG